MLLLCASIMRPITKEIWDFVRFGNIARTRANLNRELGVPVRRQLHNASFSNRARRDMLCNGHLLPTCMDAAEQKQITLSRILHRMSPQGCALRIRIRIGILSLRSEAVADPVAMPLGGGSEVSGGSRGPPNGGPGASGVYSPCLGLYVLSLAEKGAGEDFEISRSASLRLHKVEVIVRSTTIEYD